VSRPGVPLRLGAFDQEKFEFGRCPKDQRNGCLRVTVTCFGLLPVLGTAGEAVHEFTQPSVWNFHSNAPGVRLPDMFVKLRLDSDGKPVFEDPVGQIKEIACVPDR